MKLKTYPKYRNSGIQWIGKIPEGWKVDKVKHFKEDVKFSIVDGPFGTQLHSEEYVTEGIPVVRVINLTYSGNFISKNMVFITEEKFNKLKRSSIKEGDILIAKTGATIGKIGVFSGFKKAIISSSCLKLTLKNNIIHDFFKYLLISDSGQSQILSEAAGSTRDTINIEPFSTLYFSIPNKIEEQQKIVFFLNKKNFEIDTLIEKDKKLIELLKEKRIALINHTVTKGLPVCHTQTGLDPNVKMKDSEIQLIEKIPENWNAMKLKHIVSKKITDGPHETPEFVDEGVPFISAEAIKKDKIDFSKIRGYITKQVHKIYCAKCKPRKDDIFLIKSGATTGNVAIVETNDEFSIWSPLALIRSNKEKILPKLLYYILLTDYFKKTIELSWSFGTQQNIGMSVIENLNIIIPSISQQNYLLDYLNQATAKIDKTIQKIEQKIELLEKYKKSLIHHAVTGKIDVREVKI